MSDTYFDWALFGVAFIGPEGERIDPRRVQPSDSPAEERRLADAAEQVRRQIRDRKIAHDRFEFWQLGKRVWGQQA